MTSTQRMLFPVFILIAVIIVSYSKPQARYQKTEILNKINLPLETGEWRGKVISEKINLNKAVSKYIGDMKTIAYVNDKNALIYFTLIDAGNFHNPKICFSGSGYEPQELQDTQIDTKAFSFQAPTIFFRKPKANTLFIYWMVIDGKRVTWAQQKINDLFYSLMGKRRVGLIVRLDIPCSAKYIERAKDAANNLMQNISKDLPAHQAEIIFGK